ncbi:calcium uptake protein 3, mitochondrial-like isoform X2 [Gigantopelta aegis]|uniref:calcium uptake protein 3, mitochondrial-like isoform X2 n=1 Tax=Gigantopelta aegis TaxID=1735272 RepID=UPI001B88DF9A|nr:calcium uptake protein 3, mitochondrial-like isoform X2 [Gigantopelta aegis]
MATHFIYRGFRVAKRLRFLLFADEKITKVSFSRKAVYLLLAGTAWGCSYYGWLHFLHKSEVGRLIPVIYAQVENEKEKKKVEPPMTFREMRFQQFSSVEYDDVVYMTPQDFLESITEESPRPRIGRMKLTMSDLEYSLRKTPSRSRGSTRLFRNLHNNGIISYTEYLFLLCVLTKPQSGFSIAFNMFDTDGNQIVDKKEFLVLSSFFILPRKERKFVPRTREKLTKLLNEAAPHIQDTTLLVHFFGQKGKDVLKYEDFYRFMSNLQSEVIELEFLEFSRGMHTISEVDFARILLRYTLLDCSEIEESLQRVRDRMPEEKGITFQEFKQFCQFLNSLDDFAIAMKMYTFAQQPISQEEFQRAVKMCTGYTLGRHVVDTVFQIFDTDGDGHLSHPEFISIMKDRLHRGSRSHLMHTQGNWDSFKTCVKNEMKHN